MSQQQINLLSKPDQRRGRAVLVIASIGAALAVLATISIVNDQKIKGLKAKQQETVEQIALAQAELKRKRTALGLPDIEALQREIENVKSALAQNKEVLTLIQKGELGSRVGHSRLFTLLATVTEPGVWLTQIDVNKSTGPVSLSGNALDSEAVMRYSRKLNQRLSGFEGQPQLSSVEMQKEEFARATRPGVQTDAGKIPGVKFRLN